MSWTGLHKKATNKYMMLAMHSINPLHDPALPPRDMTALGHLEGTWALGRGRLSQDERRHKQWRYFFLRPILQIRLEVRDELKRTLPLRPACEKNMVEDPVGRSQGSHNAEK